jgi:3-deoxy-D-manno-octulosonic acid (KDO) 8-phosphate synthase
MKPIEFSELLDALAELQGQLLSILVAGRSGGPPVAVLIGTAGAIDMAGEEEDESSGGVAFVPVEEESAAAMGRQGVYLRAADFEAASRIGGRLIITLRELTLEIEPT